MDFEKFITEQVDKVHNDFSLDQIQRDVWNEIHQTFIGVGCLESMIYISMQIYAEIVKRIETSK